MQCSSLGAKTRAGCNGAGAGDNVKAGIAPSHAMRRPKFQEAFERKGCGTARCLPCCHCCWHHCSQATERQGNHWTTSRCAWATSKEIWLERSWPLHRNRHHRPSYTLHLRLHGAAQAAMPSGAKPTMGCGVAWSVPLQIRAIGKEAFGPSVLSNTRSSNAWLWPGLLSPPCISFRGKTKHVRGPKLLLSLRAPTFLPCPVAPLWGHVRVVLGADGSMLPTIPLAST
mmetsp:Transcript_48203/g.139671  ORF Transcript_48203/g.139671 Transcript_48203/m.139671 type:complete len:227 (-) Transcript_48203:1731-2411(-)